MLTRRCCINAHRMMMMQSSSFPSCSSSYLLSTTIARRTTAVQAGGGGSRTREIPPLPKPPLATEKEVTSVQLRQSNKDCNYFDPATWPSNSDAAKIEEMLKPHLLSAASPPNYESFAWLLQKSDFDSISHILRLMVRPPVPNKVDAVAYLDKHLNNNNDPMSMNLVVLDKHITTVRSALEQQKIVDKRFVVWMYSMRGSGKTQFLKWCVHNVFKSRLEHGRVIVRCCDRASRRDSEWMKEAVRLDEKKALCSLIWEHLKEVIHYSGKRFKAVDVAYETWKKTTREFYKIQTEDGMEPIILLDTCEMLRGKIHPTWKHSETFIPYTMLEAFALHIPAPHGCIVVGCNAGITSTSLVLTQANVTPLDPLPLINTTDRYDEAARSWQATVDTEMKMPLVELSAGVPRILRLASEKHRVSLDNGACRAVQDSFTTWRDSVRKRYPFEQQNKDLYFGCLLVSSTKFPFKNKTDEVPLPESADGYGKNFEDAVKKSIGALVKDGDSWLFAVPPISAPDMEWHRIRPSDLHPYLGDEYSKHLGTSGSVDRGVPFEKCFLFALYGRYLLTKWKAKPADDWVPLVDVLVNAVSPGKQSLLEGIDVNLSEGVKKSTSGSFKSAEQLSITWNELNSNAHHDAYLWCRKDGEESAMAIQLRHGNPKVISTLQKQLKETRDGAPLRLPLLVVHQKDQTHLADEKKMVPVNADRMSRVAWLWMMTPTKPAS